MNFYDRTISDVSHETKPVAQMLSASMTVNAKGRRQFRLYFGRDLAKRMGWRDRDRLLIRYGQREDWGSARIARAREKPGRRSILVAIETRRGKPSVLLFEASYLPAQVTCEKQSLEVVEYEIDRGAIEFKLPDWFYEGVAS